MAEQKLPNAEDRATLAKMVMALLDHWKLDVDDQAAVLGISVDTHLTLARYRQGEPLPSASHDQYERIIHLLDIHQKLRLLFPQNRELVYCWMTTANKALDNLTPVQLVRAKGHAGMQMVCDYLDRSLGA